MNEEGKNNNFENQFAICMYPNEFNYNDKTFINILIKQYKKNTKNLEIFDIFLLKEKYGEYSFLFLENIFKEYINKNFLNENNENEFLNAPKELEDKINEIISDKKYIIFKETIIFYFMSFCENFYFKKIEEEENVKKIRYNRILKKKLWKYFCNI